MAAPNWANQTIWTGDNLDVMRGMNSESVDLIYLDPPFNSKTNYAAPIGSQAAGAAFKDTWGLDDVNLAWHGEIKHEHPGLYDLLNATRRIHGDSMMSYLIYMAIRIVEMKRLLKPTGSIYLHCDPTASHYLKLLMDSVFGRREFRNEVVWQRTAGRKAGRQYGRAHDLILFYTKSRDSKWEPPTNPQSEGTVRGHDLMCDTHGLFRVSDFSGAGDGPPRKFGDQELHPPVGRHWMFDQPGVDRLMKQGRIVFSRNGRPRLKTYLSELPGVAVHDVWTDIRPVNSGAAERVGYPTQKPLELLVRIIRASSKRGEVVLDPFCGCATACIAAEQLQRQWVGIDISPVAADLVKDRMKREVGFLFMGAHRNDIPVRTDLGIVVKYNAPTNKKWLYGEQGEFCYGCQNHFQIQNLTVDHIIPVSKGGTDHISNLQLLCGHCNSVKGDKPHEYLLVLLTDKGWIKRKKRV